MISHEIIIKPLITEKTSIQKELNNQLTLIDGPIELKLNRRLNRYSMSASRPSRRCK